MLSDGYVKTKWYSLLLIAFSITCHARSILPQGYNISLANSAKSLPPLRSRIETYDDIKSDTQTRLPTLGSDQKYHNHMQPVPSNIREQLDDYKNDAKEPTIKSDLYESKESGLPTETLDNNDDGMTLNDISTSSDSRSFTPDQPSFRISQDGKSFSQSLPNIKDHPEDFYSQEQRLSYSNPASDSSQLNQVDSDINLAARSETANGISNFGQDEKHESDQTLFSQDTDNKGKQVATDLIDSYAQQQKESETAAAAPHEVTAVESDDRDFTEQVFSESIKETNDYQNLTFKALFDAKNQTHLGSLSTDGNSQEQDDVKSNANLLQNNQDIATQTYFENVSINDSGKANLTSQNVQYNPLSTTQGSFFDSNIEYENQSDILHQLNPADDVTPSSKSSVVDAQAMTDNSPVTLNDQSNEEFNSIDIKNVSDITKMGAQSPFEPTNQEYEQPKEELNHLGTENVYNSSHMDAQNVFEPINQKYEPPKEELNPLGTENVYNNSHMDAQNVFEPKNQEYEQLNKESNSTESENVSYNTQMNSQDDFGLIDKEYEQPNEELNTIGTENVSDDTHTDAQYVFEPKTQEDEQQNRELNSFDIENVSDDTQIEAEYDFQPTNQEYEQPNEGNMALTIDSSSQEAAFKSTTAQVQELEPKKDSSNQAEEDKSDDIEVQNDFETENEDLQSNLFEENDEIEDTSRGSSTLENAEEDEQTPLKEQTSTTDLSSTEENRDSIMETIVNTANSTMEKYGKNVSFAVLLTVLVVLFTVVCVLVRKCRRHRFNRRKAREIHRQEKEFLLQKQGDGRYVRDGFLNNDQSSEDEL